VAKYTGGYEEITAAGTVRDSHPIPYYPLIWYNERNHNISKYRQKILKPAGIEVFCLNNELFINFTKRLRLRFKLRKTRFTNND
jgi:intein-encoded DNA endonuclease-like protein